MASNTVVNTNVAALNSYRSLSSVGNARSKSSEKLSTGLRINRAADDAAGLAISEKMRSQIRGLNQASRNSQDGISLIQTAEGALSTSEEILQRMRVLVEQAANDPNESEDRQAIALELDALSEELNSIAEKTQFNKKTLIDGSIKDLYLQTGANSNQGLTISIEEMSAKSLGVDKKDIGDIVKDPSKSGEMYEGTENETQIVTKVITDLKDVGSAAGTYKISDDQSIDVDRKGNVTITGFNDSNNLDVDGTYSAEEFADKFGEDTKLTSTDGNTTITLNSSNGNAIEMAVKQTEVDSITSNGRTVDLANISEGDAAAYELKDVNITIGKDGTFTLDKNITLDNAKTLEAGTYSLNAIKRLGAVNFTDSSGAMVSFAKDGKVTFTAKEEVTAQSFEFSGSTAIDFSADPVAAGTYSFNGGSSTVTKRADGTFVFKMAEDITFEDSSGAKGGTIKAGEETVLNAETLKSFANSDATGATASIGGVTFEINGTTGGLSVKSAGDKFAGSIVESSSAVDLNSAAGEYVIDFSNSSNNELSSIATPLVTTTTPAFIDTDGSTVAENDFDSLANTIAGSSSSVYTQEQKAAATDYVAKLDALNSYLDTANGANKAAFATALTSEAANLNSKTISDNISDIYAAIKTNIDNAGYTATVGGDKQVLFEFAKAYEEALASHDTFFQETVYPMEGNATNVALGAFATSISSGNYSKVQQDAATAYATAATALDDIITNTGSNGFTAALTGASITATAADELANIYAELKDKLDSGYNDPTHAPALQEFVDAYEAVITAYNDKDFTAARNNSIADVLISNTHNLSNEFKGDSATTDTNVKSWASGVTEKNNFTKDQADAAKKYVDAANKLDNFANLTGGSGGSATLNTQNLQAALDNYESSTGKVGEQITVTAKTAGTDNLSDVYTQAKAALELYEEYGNGTDFSTADRTTLKNFVDAYDNAKAAFENEDFQSAKLGSSDGFGMSVVSDGSKVSLTVTGKESAVKSVTISDGNGNAVNNVTVDGEKFTSKDIKSWFEGGVKELTDSQARALNGVTIEMNDGTSYSFEYEGTDGAFKISAASSNAYARDAEDAFDIRKDDTTLASATIKNGDTLSEDQLNALSNSKNTKGTIGGVDVNIASGGELTLTASNGFEGTNADGSDLNARKGTSDIYSDAFTMSVTSDGTSVTKVNIDVSKASGELTADSVKGAGTPESAAKILSWFQNGATLTSAEDISLLAGVTVEMNDGTSYKFGYDGSDGEFTVEGSANSIVEELDEIGYDITATVEGGTEVEKTGDEALASRSGGEIISDLLDKIDNAIGSVSFQRARLGAYQNRLEYTIQNLEVSSENLSSAESRIRDTDMAQEMMQHTKTNVLQQAAMSMLAQANQAPQNVLQLLQ